MKPDCLFEPEKFNVFVFIWMILKKIIDNLLCTPKWLSKNIVEAPFITSVTLTTILLTIYYLYSFPLPIPVSSDLNGSEKLALVVLCALLGLISGLVITGILWLVWKWLSKVKKIYRKYENEYYNKKLRYTR